MGGGNLNLKKSWHPSTLKNQERVWKAQQQDEMEKKKTQELQQELKHEREKEHYQDLNDEARGSREKKNKMDWMYKGVSALVDREDYLLGRKVDKTFDVIQAAEEQEKKQVESGTGDGLPSQLFRRRNDDTDFVAVDMACKVREDPLYLIRKQEYESKKQLLSNPVRMKMLQEMIAKEKTEKNSKRKKSKKKKKKRSSDEDSDLDEEDIDAKIAKYREKLLKSTSARNLEEDRSEDRGRSSRLESPKGSGSRVRPSGERSKGSRPGDEHAASRRTARSSESPERRKLPEDVRKNTRDRRRHSRSPKRGTDYSTQKQRLSESPERRRRPLKSPERSRQASRSPNGKKRNDRASGRPVDSGSSRRRQQSKSPERRGRNHSPEARRKSISPKRRENSSSPKRRQNSRSPKRRRNSRSPKRRQNSRSPKRRRNSGSPRPTRSSVSPGRRQRDSRSPERGSRVDDDTGFTRKRPDGFGLLTSSKNVSRDDGYEKKDYRTILEERKTKEDEERRELQKRLGERRARQMTQEEKERKLREMQDDAAVHEKQRLEYVKLHTKSDSIEVEGYKEGGFRGPEMLAKAVESSSVEMRLKIRRKGLQKSSRAMETNFLRK